MIILTCILSAFFVYTSVCSCFASNPLDLDLPLLQKNARNNNLSQPLEKSVSSSVEKQDNYSTEILNKQIKEITITSSPTKPQELQCVIDLGSSGVQLGCFKVNMSQKIVEEQVFNKKERVLLQAGIHNNVLPEEIQKKAVKAIQDLLAEAKINPQHTKVFGFATAWARAADNSSQLIEAINSEAKVKIEIINQQKEGTLGLQATLAKLRSLVRDKQSFLYQTAEGKEIHSKLIGDQPTDCLMPQNVISWDIGGGSMQLARTPTEGTMDIIGSQDSSTLFANSVINLKQKIPKKQNNVVEVPQNTPNPLSGEQMKATINLAKKRAEKFVTSSFLEHIRSKDTVIFGIGQMHKSNQSYINRLLKLNLENFYTNTHLKEATKLLVDKNDQELGSLLNVPVSDIRNRLTSMLMVLGFMEYFQIETIYTIDVSTITGVFFIDNVNLPRACDQLDCINIKGLYNLRKMINEDFS